MMTAYSEEKKASLFRLCTRGEINTSPIVAQYCGIVVLWHTSNADDDDGTSTKSREKQRKQGSEVLRGNWILAVDYRGSLTLCTVSFKVPACAGECCLSIGRPRWLSSWLENVLERQPNFSSWENRFIPHAVLCAFWLNLAFTLMWMWVALHCIHDTFIDTHSYSFRIRYI